METIVLVEDGIIKCVLRNDEFVNSFAEDYVHVGNWECRIHDGEIVAEYVHEYQNLFMRHVIASVRYTVSKSGRAKLVKREDEPFPEEVLFDKKIMRKSVKKGLLVLQEDNSYLDMCEARFDDYSVSASEYDRIYEQYVMSKTKKIRIYYRANDSVMQKGAGARGKKKAALVS